MESNRNAVRDLVADPDHGALPVLLLALTVVTGVVDAVSILSLGRVFVANMTGNVVFVGFALAGAPGFSLAASLWALIGFLVGALAAGPLTARIEDRRRLFAVATALEVALLAAAFGLLAGPAGPHPHGRVADGTAALLAVALGLQNAVVRRLAVPDLTTTVLTMTLTGIAADLRRGGWTTAVRRLLAVIAMFAGAVVGAVLVLHTDPRWALLLALVLTAVVAVGAFAEAAAGVRKQRR